MDQNIATFLNVLNPQNTSTGGGSASAIAGAMGAALVAMVAYLSIGKEDMEPETFYRKVSMEKEKNSIANRSNPNGFFDVCT